MPLMFAAANVSAASSGTIILVSLLYLFNAIRAEEKQWYYLTYGQMRGIILFQRLLV